LLVPYGKSVSPVVTICTICFNILFTHCIDVEPSVSAATVFLQGCARSQHELKRGSFKDLCSRYGAVSGIPAATAGHRIYTPQITTLHRPTPSLTAASSKRLNLILWSLHSEVGRLQTVSLERGQLSFFSSQARPPAPGGLCPTNWAPQISELAKPAEKLAINRLKTEIKRCVI
jgi:hypothetical protein